MDKKTSNDKYGIDSGLNLVVFWLTLGWGGFIFFLFLKSLTLSHSLSPARRGFWGFGLTCNPTARSACWDTLSPPDWPWRQVRRAGEISALQVARDVSLVVDALNGDVLGAEHGFEGVEEGRTGERAHVAELDGAPREDDVHALTEVLGEVVAGRGEVAAFGQRVGEGEEVGEPLGLGTSGRGGGGERERVEEENEEGEEECGPGHGGGGVDVGVGWDRDRV